MVTGKFTRLLSGSGTALGVKFRPGAFRGFLGRPVREITDRRVGIEELFPGGAALAREILAERDGMVERAEAFLRDRLPEPDERVATVHRIVARMRDDRAIVGVDDVARSLAMGKRTIERLFREYVGVGPKWVIKRYRLHEAAERIASDGDWPRLALELGYFDQAHFINDFRSIVGESPARYAKRMREARDGRAVP